MINALRSDCSWHLLQLLKALNREVFMQNMRNMGTFAHLCSIILQSSHKGLDVLVGEMSVRVTRGCRLPLAEAQGWNVKVC